MVLSVFDVVRRSRNVRCAGRARPRAGLALLVVSLVAIGCGSDRTSSVPSSRSRTAVDLRTEPVALNRDDSAQHRVGRFEYAGGLELTAASTVTSSLLGFQRIVFSKVIVSTERRLSFSASRTTRLGGSYWTIR